MDRTAARARILRGHGAAASEVAELLQYNAAVLDAGAIPTDLAWPLADEPFVSRWEVYRHDAEACGAYASLQQRFPQLQFPIEAGISENVEYRNAVRKGLSTGRSPEDGLQLERPDLFSLSIRASLAGRIPVMVAGDRRDFLSLLRAFARQNEPTPVPESMGACIIAGYNNWDRVRVYQQDWTQRHPSADAAAWEMEFQALIPRKELYQDKFILLSSGPYSAVEASRLGLTPELWQPLSVAIRSAHECTHYFTRRVFSSMRNNVLDEIVADFIALIEATNAFDGSWLLTFFGLEAHPAFRPSGRLSNYLGNPPLSGGAFEILQRLVWHAVRNLGQFYRRECEQLRREEGRGQAILILSSMTLEELAEEGSPDVMSTRLARLTGDRGAEAALHDPSDEVHTDRQPDHIDRK